MVHHLPMRRPGFGCASLVLLLALLLPASAAAAGAEAFFEAPDVHYKGVEGVDDVVVTVREAPEEWIFKNGGFPESALITAGSTCTDVKADETEIACEITSVARLDLRGGDDLVLGGDGVHELAVDAGPGNDEVTICCAGDNALEGGSGDDEFKLGGATGESTVDGGPGNDTIVEPAGPDSIGGGDGSDTVDYFAEGNQTFSVTLDDQKNDGPGGNQNVHSDVENLIGGPENDHFVGTDGANLLKGERGKDELKGGAGEDILEGGADDDVIFARDGEHDTVDCGFGEDSATIDVIDTVSHCEHVSYPDLDFDGVGSNLDCNDHDASIHPGATDVPGDGIDQDCSGADAPGIFAATPLATASGALTGGRAARIRKGTGSASFRCRAPAGDTCSVKGAVYIGWKRGKASRIGSVSGRIAGARTGPLHIRLNSAGGQVLENAGNLTAMISATITNEAGTRSSFNSTIKLKSAPQGRRA